MVVFDIPKNSSKLRKRKKQLLNIQMKELFSENLQKLWCASLLKRNFPKSNFQGSKILEKGTLW